jgi:hypothetical protein
MYIYILITNWKPNIKNWLYYLFIYLFISLPTPLLTTGNFQSHFIFEIWNFPFGKKISNKKKG